MLCSPQLGTVLMFALAGTVTATAITGGFLYQAGIDGFVTRLSFPESMSFASLIRSARCLLCSGLCL